MIFFKPEHARQLAEKRAQSADLTGWLLTPGNTSQEQVALQKTQERALVEAEIHKLELLQWVDRGVTAALGLAAVAGVGFGMRFGVDALGKRVEPTRTPAAPIVATVTSTPTLARATSTPEAISSPQTTRQAIVLPDGVQGELLIGAQNVLTATNEYCHVSVPAACFATYYPKSGVPEASYRVTVFTDQTGGTDWSKIPQNQQVIPNIGEIKEANVIDTSTNITHTLVVAEPKMLQTPLGKIIVAPYDSFMNDEELFIVPETGVKVQKQITFDEQTGFSAVLLMSGKEGDMKVKIDWRKNKQGGRYAEVTWEGK